MNYDCTATPRELIFLVTIVSILIIIGLAIHRTIRRAVADANLKYTQALQIEKPEMFDWAWRTSVGDAFAEGDLDAEVPVTANEINGKYLSIHRLYQEYRMHTYTTTVGSGKNRRTVVRHYWSWDTMDEKWWNARRIVFCGKTMPSGKIAWPKGRDENATVDIGYHKRYVFYTTPKHLHGTIYTKFADGDMASESAYWDGKTLEYAYKDSLTGKWWKFVFWILYLAFVGGVGYYFCMIDNRWLED